MLIWKDFVLILLFTTTTCSAYSYGDLMTYIRETALSIPKLNGGPLIGFVAGGFSATAPPVSVRPATSDVDYLLHPLQQAANSLVDRASQQTATKHPGLGSHWMNNEIADGILNNPHRDEIIANSMRQNVHIFDSERLVLLAVWWDFQLSQKFNIISDLLDEAPDKEDYDKDLLDAAGFLRQIVLRQGSSVTVSQASALGRFQSGNPILAQAMQMVNQKYQERYSAHGIITDSGYALPAPGPLPQHSDEEDEGWGSDGSRSPLESIEDDEGTAAAHWGGNSGSTPNRRPVDTIYYAPSTGGRGSSFRDGRPPRRLNRRRTQDII